MDVVKSPVIVAVSGVKNSGKTTFLEKLVAELKSRGHRVAVIKHDGHEFEPDVEGTDTWKLRKAGAYGTAIFSGGRWMVVKEERDMDEKRLVEMFPEADFILLEGFKYSAYPKFEIVRKGNSDESVCDPKTLLALVTDTDLEIADIPRLNLEDWKKAAEIMEGFLS
ncbi:MAG: molybdopterin-guanine dinucleotide biosynthesis protein B [Lachnospiraceae bacterium]|nr:molybdopterin-guanine dinucleotide biosynthesis protein B [Lachnospiraceae bacterium]